MSTQEYFDHGELVAEEEIARRQIVTVLLVAPVRPDAVVADHEALIKATILSRVRGRERTQEQW